MARIKIPRKVTSPPVIKGFKPYGGDTGNSRKEAVTLHFEEYEALRLCDYDMYNHHQASGLMGVSRPTFTRIYASARMKIAKALAEGRQLEIEGGKVYFDSDWYRCEECGCHFNRPDKTIEPEECPLCGSKRFIQHKEDDAVGAESRKSADECVCPRCGYSRKKQLGVPCRNEVCPTCNTPLIRKT